MYKRLDMEAPTNAVKAQTRLDACQSFEFKQEKKVVWVVVHLHAQQAMSSEATQVSHVCPGWHLQRD